MGISFVQATDGNGTTTAVVPFVSNNSAGNLLIAWGLSLGSASLLSIQDSQSNVWIPSPNIQNVVWGGSGGTVSSAWYCLTTKAGANTVTLTSTTANFAQVAIAEYSGIASFDQDAQTSGFTRTTASSGNITTTSAIELLVGLYATRGGTVTAFGGYTARVNDTANGIYLADSTTSSITTTSSNDTLSSSVADIIGIMTFAAAGSGSSSEGWMNRQHKFVNKR